MTTKSCFILTEFSTPDSVFYNKVNLRNFVRTGLHYDVRKNICQRCPYLVLQLLDNTYERLLSQNTIDACEAHVMMSHCLIGIVEIGMWKLWKLWKLA